MKSGGTVILLIIYIYIIINIRCRYKRKVHLSTILTKRKHLALITRQNKLALYVLIRLPAPGRARTITKIKVSSRVSRARALSQKFPLSPPLPPPSSCRNISANQTRYICRVNNLARGKLTLSLDLMRRKRARANDREGEKNGDARGEKRREREGRGLETI